MTRSFALVHGYGKYTSFFLWPCDWFFCPINPCIWLQSAVYLRNRLWSEGCLKACSFFKDQLFQSLFGQVIQLHFELKRSLSNRLWRINKAWDDGIKCFNHNYFLYTYTTILNTQKLFFSVGRWSPTYKLQMIFIKCSVQCSHLCDRAGAKFRATMRFIIFRCHRHNKHQQNCCCEKRLTKKKYRITHDMVASVILHSHAKTNNHILTDTL